MRSLFTGATVKSHGVARGFTDSTVDVIVVENTGAVGCERPGDQGARFPDCCAAFRDVASVLDSHSETHCLRTVPRRNVSAQGRAPLRPFLRAENTFRDSGQQANLFC